MALSATETLGSDADQAARGLLVELEERLAAKDLDAILGIYTDDAILIGDDSSHLTHEGTVTYLQAMAEMAPIIRWDWEQVVATSPAAGVLAFAAVGTLGFHGPAGELLAPRGPFRMTCLAIDADGQGDWRIRHFHGSRPDH